MPRGGHNAISEATLVDDLRELADRLGRSPSQKDINEHSKHSHKTYYRKFDGGLREAKGRAGLEMNDQITRTRVTVECGFCGAELDRKPSEVEANEYCYCDQACLNEHKRERYAGENNPQSTLEPVECAQCGETLLRPKWKREANERHFCDYQCMGEWRSEHVRGQNHPKWAEFPTIYCEYCDRPFEVRPSLADVQRFCSSECKYAGRDYSDENNPSWKGGPVTKECRHCGEEYTVKPSLAPESKFCSGSCRMASKTGEDHPRWNPDSESLYYGGNWNEQRTKAIIRDAGRCQTPGCHMTIPGHIEQYGIGLDVHHIDPLASFKEGDDIDYARANDLSNLVTLCRGHHRQIETDGSSVDFR